MKYFLLMFRMLVVIFQRISYALTFALFPPPFISAVVVIREGNEVLLLDRTDGLGLSLPGGFVGLKEKTEEAAKREVKEETGLDIKITQIITILSGIRRGTRIYSADVVYGATVIGNKTPHDSFEGRCKWISLDTIHQHKIALDYSDVLLHLPKI